jgi:two-component system, LytTR family, response regulator
MKRHKVLIVEDSLVMARIVREIVKSHFPEIELITEEDSVSGAINSIAVNKPELVIMDIQLNEGTAFDVLEQLGNINFKVIFMSAFHEYLIEALRFSAVEFVYKPFDASDMVSAIAKAFDNQSVKAANDTYNHQIRTLLENVKLDPASNKLVLHGHNNHLVVPIRDVLFIKADLSKSVFTFAKHTNFTANLPLRRFESMLKQRHFFRCHPFYLVNLLHVDFVDPLANALWLKTGISIAIEPRKYEELMIGLEQLRCKSTNT